MNKLITKARSGVTLVELLVVILIVTILSVSMLPLLQPFVTEAQYAAEPIPVIGNLRTKIGMYQYDKGRLPTTGQEDDVHAWKKGVKTTTGQGSTLQEKTDDEAYGACFVQLSTGQGAAAASSGTTNHLSIAVDIDFQDLKGKRSKPNHYFYYPLSSTNNSYVVGCFGDGNGLKAGTGYAVCELNYTAAGKKYIGTWKRYKPVDDNASQICFSTDNMPGKSGKTVNCYIPKATSFANDINSAKDGTGKPPLVVAMEQAGWEF